MSASTDADTVPDIYKPPKYLSNPGGASSASVAT
jgi:hypothetical protein